MSNNMWHGMTIRNILDKVDLSNVDIKGEGGLDLKSRNTADTGADKLMMKSPDHSSAYLGPKPWQKPISLNLEEGDVMGDVMNIEEFLQENNIKMGPLGHEKGMKTEGPPTPPYSATDLRELPGSNAPDVKPPLRPSIIVTPKSPVTEKQKVLEEDNNFLYTESKRAKMEREKEELRKRLEVEFPYEDLALATVPGASFDPKERSFDLDELRPQPIIKKRKKIFIPDEKKDGNYWEKRMKNNQAARRSREARRLKENQIALRVAFLERENKSLAEHLETSQFENSKLNTEREILMMKLSKYERFASH